MSKALERLRAGRYLVFAALPVLLYVAGLAYRAAMGPYFLAYNLDPEYAYLLNALNLLNGDAIAHTDHPGTPLHVLMAALIKAYHAFGLMAKEDIRVSALANPEAYLSFISGALLVANSLVLFTLGIAAFRYTKSMAIGLALQLSPFMSETVLRYLPRVSPEPVLLLAGMVTMIALFAYLQKGGQGDAVPLVMLSLCVGFGMATKIIFFPVLLVPIFVIPGVRKRAVFLLGAAAGFVFFTLPVIGQYPRIFGWLGRFAAHEGRYGRGGEGVVKAGKIVPNLLALIAGQRVFVVVVALCLAALAALVFRPRLRAEKHGRTYSRLLAGVAACDLAIIAMFVKQPEPRYLIPALFLSGLGVAVLLLMAKDNLKTGARWGDLVAALAVAAALVFTGGEMKRVLRTMSSYRDSSLEFSRSIEQRYPGYARVYFYGASSPLYALHFGNFFAGFRHADALRSLYGDNYFLNVFGPVGRLTGFSNKAVDFGRFVDGAGGKVIFHGSSVAYVEYLFPKGMNLREVERRGDETVFLHSPVAMFTRWTGRHGDGWTGRTATLAVNGYTSGDLKVSLPAHPRIIKDVLPVTVTVKGGNGRSVSLLLDKANMEHVVDVSQFVNGGAAEISIKASKTWRPVDLGMNKDRRYLGVMVDYELR